MPDVLGQALRDDWGRLLGRLIRSSGRPDLAEDALAEAFVQAAEQWHGRHVPANPAGWLSTTAQRRLIDAQRAEVRRRTPEFRRAVASAESVAPVEPTPGDGVDDRMALLFMATHPALADDVRPALALRFVLGIPTEVIARLFLVPTPTMAARLTRAKRRLAEIGAAFRVPPPSAWPERVDDVARAIYLAFTAGYAPGGDEVRRTADARTPSGVLGRGRRGRSRPGRAGPLLARLVAGRAGPGKGIRRRVVPGAAALLRLRAGRFGR